MSPALETGICDDTIESREEVEQRNEMRTSVHYLYYQAVEDAKGLQMTEQQRADQLVSRVFGNVHIEYPEVTRELVHAVVQHRRQAGTVDGIVAR